MEVQKCRENEQMKRIEWIDMLKGIGVIAVVVGHFYNNETLLQIISSFHMSLFFFVSGYLFLPQKIGTWISKKYSSIIKPYIFFSIVSGVAWYFLTTIQGKPYELFVVIKGYLWGDYTSIVYNRVLWFIPAFFCTITIYNVFVNLMGERTAWVLSVLVGILWVCDVELPNLPWGIDEALFHYLPIVALGNISAKIGVIEKVRFSKKVHRFNCCFFLLAIDILLLFCFESNRVIELLTAVIGVSICSVMSISFEHRGFLLKRIGQASLTVMGLQAPVYDMFSKTYRTMLGIAYEECMGNIVHAFVCCTMTITICYVLHVLIWEKYRVVKN